MRPHPLPLLYVRPHFTMSYSDLPSPQFSSGLYVGGHNLKLVSLHNVKYTGGLFVCSFLQVLVGQVLVVEVSMVYMLPLLFPSLLPLLSLQCPHLRSTCSSFLLRQVPIWSCGWMRAGRGWSLTSTS